MNPGAAGTSEDPYVIEGWCIVPVPEAVENGTEGLVPSAGIRIEDTTAHVVVRHNRIDGHRDLPTDALEARQRVGIELRDTENVSLVDNIVREHAGNGVSIADSSHLEVADNTVTGNHGHGVLVNSSADVALADNTVTENVAEDSDIDPTGVAFGKSNGATVAGNSIGFNEGHGLHLEDAEGTTVLGNTIEENQRTEVFLDHADGTTIVDNTVTRTRFGTEADGDGIFLQGADRTTIANNTISGNSVGIRSPEFEGFDVVHEEGLRIVNNTIVANIIGGVKLRRVADVTLENNTVRNRDEGIEVHGVDGAIRIADNTVNHHRFGGVTISDADRASVDGNIVRDAEGGISVFSSSTVSVTNNTVADHREFFGVNVARNGETTVAHNNITDNDAIGLRIARISDVTATNNTIARNGQGLFDMGVRVVLASNVTLTRNNIYDSEGPGLDVRFVDDAVDARNNWWGASNGPSGSVTDDCTGETADGDGDAIVLGSEGKVCFDPWLDAPSPDAGVG